VFDSDEAKAVVRLNRDGTMTRVERVPPPTSAGKDVMTLLLMAYREMLNDPACTPLLKPLMGLIHAREEMMTQQNSSMEGNTNG
jgi:hypothetical protein